MSSDTGDRSATRSGLLPIIDAASALGRSTWTLKRLYHAGHLPAVIIGGQWLIPESFVAMVITSPRPGRAGVLEDIADHWFAVHSADAEAVTA